MKEAINGFLPQTSPNPGSTKRENQYRESLSKDDIALVFDDVAKDLLMPYALNPKQITKEIEYLDSIVSQDGYHFSRAIKQYSKIEEGILRFGEKDYTSFRWNRYYREALKGMVNEYSRFHLNPIRYYSDEDIRKSLPKEDTSAGYTRIITGLREKGANLDNALVNFQEAVSAALEAGSFNIPIMVAYRTQASGEYSEGKRTGTFKSKTRAVSIVALPIIIAESKFSRPFQRAYGMKNIYVGSKNDDEVNAIVQTGRGHYSSYISLDYSHYDQSISSWLIEDVFDVILSSFQGLSEEELMLWDVIKHDFIHKTFMLGDRNVESHKGVPSGSMFTQIVDSLVNELMIRTAMLAFGLEESQYQMQIMGDDNLIMYTTGRDLSADLCSYIQHNFGITVNLDKSTHGKTDEAPEFLSARWYSTGKYRHPFELLSRILYPESRRPYKKDREHPENLVTEDSKCNPWDVIYSYCLAYPLGMQELIDVERFKEDAYQRRGDKLKESLEFTTGFIRFRALYGDTKYSW